MRNKSLAKHPMTNILIGLGLPRRKARRMVIDVLSNPVKCNAIPHTTYPASFCIWCLTKHGDAWAAIGGFNA